ncbi:MAG TPA: hypothetical protein VEL76_00395 [Gemmataceae bacterium]|nr:hypothetical protein [Gemmataceae bacterium]
MSSLLKLTAIVAFLALGGFLLYTGCGCLDRLLTPECDLIRVAGIALFATFAVVFGALVGVWPISDRNDPFISR